MMRLYVDGLSCDIAEESRVPCGFDADSLADLDAARTGRSLTLTLPRTATNDRIFCHADDIYAAERFNASHHTARIDFGMATLMEGTAVLLSTRLDKGHGGYEVRITEGAAEWAEKAAHTALGETPIELDMTLTPTVARLPRRVTAIGWWCSTTRRDASICSSVARRSSPHSPRARHR